MRGAQELANDLHHALELVENERDEAVRERDEAQAVIDAVRKVRDALDGLAEAAHAKWRREGDHYDLGWGDASAKAVAQLNGVDGL